MDEITTKNDSGLAELLSQLEESKFLRLFRHLVDEPDGLNRPAVPLDLPDAEMQVKITGKVSSLRSWAIAQLFQVAYLPSFLWEPESAKIFVSNQLRLAFAGLKSISTLVNALEEFSSNPNRSVHRLYPTVEDIAYYFFTNVCYDVDERALGEFSELARRLFKEALDNRGNRDDYVRSEADSLLLVLERNGRFGIGTPATVVSYAPGDVKRFVIELLNMPSSYYFVAREGQISIVPTTERGAFLASNSTMKPTIGLSAVVTSALSARDYPSPPGLSDFHALINGAKTKEEDLQCFLEANPHFLFALDERYCEIRPHVCLIDNQRERLVPDFMARVEDSNIWDVIELKRPQHSLTVRHQGEEKPSAAAAHAIAELLQYRDFFGTRDNRNRVVNRFKTAPYEPCLVLVIGRGRSTQRYEWQSTRLGFPRARIVSYDYIFERARERSESSFHNQP
jgi:hypothetical protein